MTTRTMTPQTTFAAPHDVAAGSLAAVQRIGMVLLRYGLVFLLLLWGAFKFTAFEAEAIEPLVRSHPLVRVSYELLGQRGGSALFGVVEIGAGLGIALRRWLPRVSGRASLVAAGIFALTSSFLLTLPGAFEPTNPWGGFLMKDLILLGAALVIAAEALGAARRASS